MTVITSNSKNSRTSTRTPDEYEGLFMNPGIFVGGEGDKGDAEKKFVRMNRGVAVSDLTIRKLYDSMDPDFAAEQQLLNDRVEAIRERALELAEGEYVVVNIPMVLYRRQEEASVKPTPKAAKADIRAELFG